MHLCLFLAYVHSHSALLARTDAIVPLANEPTTEWLSFDMDNLKLLSVANLLELSLSFFEE